ncbi:MAG: molybdate ABC transporter substrate-binding protein [Deltaproteobacteria bacterium]|nr:molybdate ABC transporter substrate-binding protein [Deltaproteobacteria bacterium]
MARFLITVVIILNFFVSGALADSLVIAAGAGYKRMLEEVIRVYENKTGAKVDQIFGHMGQVLIQAKASGIVSLILGEYDFLKASDVEFDSFHKIGHGILVIVYGKDVKLQKPEDLSGKDISKIAIPDPKQAIYGKAAKEFLQNAGLDQKVEKKLLIVSTVPQVSAYIISKDVEAGFVNLTDAIYVKDRIGGFIELDKDKYQPINLVVGVVKGFGNRPEVSRFLNFIQKDPDAKAIIAQSGL